MPVLMVAAGLATFAVSLTAAAQFAGPEDAICDRREALTAMAAAPLAKTGNVDAIKAAVGETGKSCKACHDVYRKDSADSTLLSPRRAARAP